MLKYQIYGGSAIRDSDYYSPKLNLDITQEKSPDFAEDIVYVPAGSTEAKIYISAIDDEIFEDPEDIKIKLIPFDLYSDYFGYRYYNVSENNNTSTITINDSGDFKAGIVITPKNRTGISTIRADLINGIQTAEFDVHLTSKPFDDVSILTSSSGSLSSEIIDFKKK